MEKLPWNVRLIKKLFSKRFKIAHLTRFSIIGKLIDNLLFKGDSTIYLPKQEVIDDNLIEINTTIDKPDEILVPSNVLKHFIKKATYIVKMNFCLCRYSNECKDYPIEYGCLFLGESAKKINKELGEEISVDEALEYLKKCTEVGLFHLIARNKIDSIWLNAKPDYKLLTICNCCPCCCVWKATPHFQGRIGERIAKRIIRMPGIEFKVQESCIGCGKCIENNCIVDAIDLRGEKAEIKEICIGCGRCAIVCPNQSIKMIVHDEKFINNTIEQISSVIEL
jgi:ferredoxin